MLSVYYFTTELHSQATPFSLICLIRSLFIRIFLENNFWLSNLLCNGFCLFVVLRTRLQHTHLGDLVDLQFGKLSSRTSRVKSHNTVWSWSSGSNTTCLGTWRSWCISTLPAYSNVQLILYIMTQDPSPQRTQIKFKRSLLVSGPWHHSCCFWDQGRFQSWPWFKERAISFAAGWKIKSHQQIREKIPWPGWGDGSVSKLQSAQVWGPKLWSPEPT